MLQSTCTDEEDSGSWRSSKLVSNSSYPLFQHSHRLWILEGRWDPSTRGVSFVFRSSQHRDDVSMAHLWRLGAASVHLSIFMVIIFLFHSYFSQIIIQLCFVLTLLSWVSSSLAALIVSRTTQKISGSGMIGHVSSMRQTILKEEQWRDMGTLLLATARKYPSKFLSTRGQMYHLVQEHMATNTAPSQTLNLVMVEE